MKVMECFMVEPPEMKFIYYPIYSLFNHKMKPEIEQAV